MKVISKYWKVILALVMLLAAVLVYVLQYLPAKTVYELEQASLRGQIETMQMQVGQNTKYASVQDQLDPAIKAITDSRRELYDKFPVEMKEEDQIMYMLYLEEKFGKEVTLEFAEEETIVALSDGAELQGVTVMFDYETTYAGFKKMIQELATDSRITSVRFATMDYDTEADLLRGKMVVTNYVMSDDRTYEGPEVDTPAIGKDNPYKD